MFSSFLRGVCRLSLPLLVLVAGAEPLRSQEPTSKVVLLRELSKQDQVRAMQENEMRSRKIEALFVEAQQLEAAGSWDAAARRFEEAGMLRSAHDARALEAFSASARSYHAAGDRREAARMSETAGKRALELGEVYLAAVSLQHAAVLRAEIGQSIRAQELAWHSCRLSSSPSLSETERANVQAGFTNCSAELQRLAMSMEN